MKYHVVVKVNLRNETARLRKAVIIMPLPQSDLNQDVSNLKCGGGRILRVPDSEDKYLRFVLAGDALRKGESKDFSYRFDVALYNVVADFSLVKEVVPYRTTSAAYRRYTGKSGVYVDPTDKNLKAISAKLWHGTKNTLDYAKSCHDYVAGHYLYLNPGTGLHPLAKLLADGGGDCGNLSSIFISLLRCRGIPARHVVTVNTKGEGHVWAEFYLERHGWIPVDVTSSLGTRSTYYFGRIPANFGGITFSRTINAPVDLAGKKFNLAILQTYALWAWNKPFNRGKVSSTYAVQAERIIGRGTDRS